MPCPFTRAPRPFMHPPPPSLQCQTLWCLLQRRWEWSATTGPTGGTRGQGGGPACSVSACCRPARALLVQQSPAAPTDVVAKADPAVRMGWPPLKCRVGVYVGGWGAPSSAASCPFDHGLSRALLHTPPLPVCDGVQGLGPACVGSQCPGRVGRVGGGQGSAGGPRLRRGPQPPGGGPGGRQRSRNVLGRPAGALGRPWGPC